MDEGFDGGLCWRRPVIVAMLNPSRDFLSQQIAASYFSAVYIMLAIWAGLGMMTVAALVARVRIGSFFKESGNS